jgi:hypothetical protein
MRRILLAACLLLVAFVARGDDSASALQFINGGFIPGAAHFRVTFDFSNLSLHLGASSVRKLGASGLANAAWKWGKWGNPRGVSAELNVCCVNVPFGLNDMTLAALFLRLSNPTDRPWQTSLSVAITPEGQLPALAFGEHAFSIEGRPVLVANTPSRGCILADSPFADRPLSPQNIAHVESAKGECRGEMLYDLTLQPGQSQTLGFIAPMKSSLGSSPDLKFYRSLSIEDLFKEAEKQATSK